MRSRTTEGEILEKKTMEEGPRGCRREKMRSSRGHSVQDQKRDPGAQPSVERNQEVERVDVHINKDLIKKARQAERE